MPNRLALALIATALVASCGGTSNDPGPGRARPCDDGGSGGVMIDGVCL